MSVCNALCRWVRSGMLRCAAALEAQSRRSPNFKSAFTGFVVSSSFAPFVFRLFGTSERTRLCSTSPASSRDMPAGRPLPCHSKRDNMSNRSVRGVRAQHRTAVRAGPAAKKAVAPVTASGSRAVENLAAWLTERGAEVSSVKLGKFDGAQAAATDSLVV